jgi:hypothetical protein
VQPLLDKGAELVHCPDGEIASLKQQRLGTDVNDVEGGEQANFKLVFGGLQVGYLQDLGDNRPDLTASDGSFRWSTSGNRSGS